MANIAGTTDGLSKKAGIAEAVERGLKRRYQKEARFKLYGLLAIGFALVTLVVLFTTIISNGIGAFWQSELALEVDFSPEDVDPENIAGGNFRSIAFGAIRKEFPTVPRGRRGRPLTKLLSTDAPFQMQRAVQADPGIIGTTQTISVPLSDDADIFLKGKMTPVTTISGDGALTLAQAEGHTVAHSTGTEFLNVLEEVRGFSAATAEIEDGVLKTSSSVPSYFLSLHGGLLKVTSISESSEGKVLSVAGTEVKVEVIVSPLSQDGATGGEWKIVRIDVPEDSRRLNDKQIAWLLTLDERGKISQPFNTTLFTSGDSREPEQAGIWGAAVGSFWTLLVTLVLSFPIGVMAAVYLEEFAPKNRLTDIIEVNINNLAAVPSIVFGLLGLALFLNFFGLPRSAPLVGGLVLTLMTLPTIIIASRAALKSVPPSIRQAALGMGASRLQAMTHHVLPLAMPGMLTGTIIGMAQALGETAPLLMIGMVAFIVDIPGGPTDPATVLPVQIFLWADAPERAFVERTSAAIMVLLAFLITMNLTAVLLRKKFETRW